MPLRFARVIEPVLCEPRSACSESGYVIFCLPASMLVALRFLFFLPVAKPFDWSTLTPPCACYVKERCSRQLWHGMVRFLV